MHKLLRGVLYARKINFKGFTECLRKKQLINLKNFHKITMENVVTAKNIRFLKPPINQATSTGSEHWFALYS